MGSKDVAPALDARSIHLRRLILRAFGTARRGHLGASMSLVEILRVLYDDIMTFDPQSPEMPTRDRLILSKGHGCVALYAVLADWGFFSTQELESFCDFESILGGHPESRHVPGVEASTGALGHGLPIGVGMAYAARLRDDCHRVYVILGDGELNEGSNWEAAMAAAHHSLSNLIVIVDNNGHQAYGERNTVWNLGSITEKWRAFGFMTYEVDGHSVLDLRSVLATAQRSTRPVAVIANTVKGRGVPFAEANPSWHHKSKIHPDELLWIDQALRDA